MYIMECFDPKMCTIELSDNELDAISENSISTFKIEEFKVNFIGKSIYFNENTSHDDYFSEGDYCLFAIFSMRFGEMYITMRNYLNKDNDESKKYVTFGSNKLIFSKDEVYKDLNKPAVKRVLYLSNNIFKEMIEKIQKYKENQLDISESITPLQKLYKVQKIYDNKIDTQDMHLKELLENLAYLFFDASDMTKFPMFPIDIKDIINYEMLFALKLEKPKYQNPSSKKNLKPFAVYVEKKVENKENKSRFFMPQLLECIPKEKTVISSVTSYYTKVDNVEYRLCNVNNRHITECYPANEGREIINFNLGTLVSFIVYSPFFIVDTDASKIMWVSFRKDGSFVGYPELIRADKNTFGEKEIKPEEREWLREKNLLDVVNHVIKRKFGVITKSGIALIDKNPFFIDNLKDHPDFVVVYQEITMDMS